MKKTFYLIFIFFIQLSVSAQSPGGVSTPNLWLKADVGTNTITDGANVSSWLDQSGGGKNVTQATAALQPLYANSASNWVNFNPAVRFGATAQTRMTGPDLYAGAQTAGSFFMVSLETARNNGYSMCLMSTTNPLRNSLEFSVAGTGLRYNTNFGNFGTGSYHYPLGTPGIATFLFQGGTAQSINENNFQRGVNTGTIPASLTTDGVYVGSIPTHATYYRGYFPEIISYGRLLTAAEQARVASYLALKYGVTLEQQVAQSYIASDGTTKMWDHTQATSGYNLNIFGIGRDNDSGLYQKISKSVNSKSIVALSQENNFTLSNIDAGRGSFLTDKQFLTIADNNSATAPAWGTTGAVIPGLQLLNNNWEVQNTGSVGGVYLQFDVANTNYDIPALSNNNLYLIYDNSGTISASSVVIKLTQNGNLYTTPSPIAFSNKAKFTIATGDFVYPGGVAGLNLWLKANADTNTTTDGANVSSWLDQSGLGNNVAQATAALQPLYANSTSNRINFNPAIRFGTSARTLLAGPDLYGGTQTAGSVFAVSLEAARTNNYSIALRNNTSTRNSLEFYLDNVTTGLRYNFNATTFTTGGYPYPMGTPGIGSFLYQASTAHSIRVNNYQWGTNTGTIPVSLTTDGFYIGTILGAGTGVYYNGYFPEIISYGKLLTDAEQLRVTSYVALKYGITLDQQVAQSYMASDGITKIWDAAAATSGYNQNIFGIGRDDISALYQKVSKSVNQKGIVTVALDNNFTLANNDVSRTGTLTDKQFLTIADYNSAATPAFGALGAVIANKQLLNNTWEVQNIGGVGGVYLQFETNNTNYNIPPFPPTTNLYLIYDNSGTISASSPMVALTQSGTMWSTVTPVTFSSKAKFTLATDLIVLPGGVSGAALWLRADKSVGLSSGTLVNAWNDFSGTGNNALQVTPANQPDLIENQSNFNPTVRFTPSTTTAVSPTAIAGADYLTIPEGSISFNDTRIFLSGLRNTGVANNSWAERTGSTTGVDLNNRAISLGDVGVNFELYDAWYLNGSATAYATNAALRGVYALFNGAAPNNITDGLDIGNGDSGYVNFQGDQNEWIIMSNASSLTTTQINQINSYLALKYGITLNQTTAQNYTASDGTTKMWDAAAATAGYNQNIFGIGRDDTSALYQKVSKTVNQKGIITIALDNNFTLANNDVLRTGTLTDKQFLTIADYNSAATPAFGALGAVIANKQLLNNTWEVQNIGGVGGVYLQFETNNTNYNIPPFPPTNLYLIYDNSGTISASSPMVALTQSGTTWSTTTPVTFSNKAKFTLATDLIVSPGGVEQPGIWLKANAGISVADGASVATWVDQSGTRINNATNSGELSTPVYRNSSTKWLNFNPSVEFNGVDSGLNYGDDYIFTPAVNLGLNIFTASKSDDVADATKTAAYIFDFGQQSPLGFGISHSSHGRGIYSPSTFGGVARFNTYASDGLPFQTNSVLVDAEYTFGTNGDGVVKQRLSLNTKSIIADANITIADLDDSKIEQASSHQSNSGPMTIGRESKSSTLTLNGNRAFDGLMGEVVLYNRKMTATERLQINSYLALKYGITLDQQVAQSYMASDGITKMWDSSLASSGFNKDIFGLGRDDLSGLEQRISRSVNTGAILTISTDTDFTNANSTHAGVGTSDKSFLTLADNGGTTSLATTALGGISSLSPLLNNINKIWQAQDTGGFGCLNYRFDMTGMDMTAGKDWYIVTSDDKDFLTNVQYQKLTVSSNLAEVSINFNDNVASNFFTLAQFDKNSLGAGTGNIVGISTTSFDWVPSGNSAVLEIQSADLAGMVVTRVNGTASIADPAEGMIIFDMSDSKFKLNTDGTAGGWRELGVFSKKFCN